MSKPRYSGACFIIIIFNKRNLSGNFHNFIKYNLYFENVV